MARGLDDYKIERARAMTDERPKELCSECEAETGRAGREEDSLYVETSKGERGPLCQACYTTWGAVAGRVVIRFDGPPAPRSGRFIEIERDGFSISYGDWIEYDGDWLLILPDGAAAETTNEFQGLAGDLHKILDALDIGRVAKGRVIIRQRVREGIEELEAEVNRLIKVMESIAEDDNQGIVSIGKASDAIALGVGRRRRIKS